MTDQAINQRMNEVRNAFVCYAKDNNRDHISKIKEVDLMMAAQDQGTIRAADYAVQSIAALLAEVEYQGGREPPKAC